MFTLHYYIYGVTNSHRIMSFFFFLFISTVFHFSYRVYVFNMELLDFKVMSKYAFKLKNIKIKYLELQTLHMTCNQRI